MMLDTTNSSDCIPGGKLFIPISLGNHYYSTDILRQLICGFIAKSRVSVIFLCDRLRFISYRLRGESDPHRINAKIDLQLNQMARTLTKLGIGSLPHAMTASWSLLEADPRYGELLAALQELMLDDDDLRRHLDTFAIDLLNRFPPVEGLEHRASMQLQREYILEETALSLFMTEIRGFNIEVYRKGQGFIDHLYRERPDALMLLTNSSGLRRKFVSIESWLATARAPA